MKKSQVLLSSPPWLLGSREWESALLHNFQTEPPPSPICQLSRRLSLLSCTDWATWAIHGRFLLRAYKRRQCKAWAEHHSWASDLMFSHQHQRKLVLFLCWSWHQGFMLQNQIQREKNLVRTEFMSFISDTYFHFEANGGG